MKTSIAKKEFLEKISGASRLGSSGRVQNNTLGVFLSFQNNELYVYGVGESRQYRSVIKAKIEEAGGDFCVQVDSKKIIEFLTSVLHDEVVLYFLDSGLKISLGKTSALFPVVLDAPTPDFSGEMGFSSSFDPKLIEEHLKNLLYCTSSDSSRPILSSVKVIPREDNSVYMVSTDGFRLSIVQTSLASPLESPIQIPAPFLRDVFGSIINNQEKVKMSVYKDGRVVFEQGTTLVSSRTVVGDFPPYEKVLVKNHTFNIVFTKNTLIQAVKSMSVFSRDFSNIVVLDISKSLCVVRPKKEAGPENKAEIAVVVEGISDQTISVAFNYHYILDYLGSVDDEAVTVRLSRADSPALFLPGEMKPEESHEGASYQHIIMPVRIQE